jgi:hypothetical protein
VAHGTDPAVIARLSAIVAACVMSDAIRERLATVPGYESTSPLAILAPASTPAAIVTKLNEAIVA